MSKIIFVSGVAGTGKTTVSKAIHKYIPAVYLDKDTVGGKFSEQFLKATGYDPNDRDSKYYKKHCRDLEYDVTMDLAMENASLGLDSILIGPFTKEIETKEWLEKKLTEFGLSRDDITVKVLFVTLKDTQLQKERIMERGAMDRDKWKMENWDEYGQSLDLPTVAWGIHETDIMVFDNSGELTEDKVKKIVTFLER
ncbi:ATP-binding protein [Lederbergia sp. NSJ-179]|uniref:AAA family ATPase n=1 Tax=Lederbergia sp. NSJ-179 TaxID=2931402 RepID=UPI001FD5D804|nr:AAA family ATPase [Lederbergia sp. NSJ-179]MCJ7843207.1 ATP-binding protein [Lederbergia sp. NSJ-179]